MIQQSMARKAHDNVGAIYKYLLVGEPGFPIAILPRGRRILVEKSEVFQVGDKLLLEFFINSSCYFD